MKNVNVFNISNGIINIGYLCLQHVVSRVYINVTETFNCYGHLRINNTEYLREK